MKMANFFIVMICVGIALLFLGSCGKQVAVHDVMTTATPYPASAPMTTFSTEPGSPKPGIMEAAGLEGDSR